MDKTVTKFDPRSSDEVFSKSRLVLHDQIEVGGRAIAVGDIIANLQKHVTEERLGKLQSVVANRSFQLVSVLENIYDRGNVSAVMRSAEAFGYIGFHLVDPPGARFKAANRVTKGAEKWLDVRVDHSPADAVAALKAQGYGVYATQLGAKTSIKDLDFSKKIAVVLGNEKEGVSEEMIGLADGTFSIPMSGFSQSFNISVAAALVFYHAHWEHRWSGKGAVLPVPQQRQILANYLLRCFDRPEIYFR